MKTMQFNVADGIDALCELLPNLGQHEHSRPIRDHVLQLAAGLLAGDYLTALIELQTRGDDSYVVVVGEVQEDRAKLIAQYVAERPRRPCQILTFPARTTSTPQEPT